MKTVGEVSLFLMILTFASTKQLDSISDQKIRDIDVLIEALQQETWHVGELACIDKTVALLHGLKNNTLWATWVWDANQLPTGLLYGSSYQLGNFDQCISPPWLDTHPHLRTQYCTADVTLTNTQLGRTPPNRDPYESTKTYIDTESKHGIRFNSVYWGVCVPASCRARSVAKLLRHMYSRSQYAAIIAEPNVTVHYCQVAGAEYRYPTEIYTFIAIIAFLLITVLISTFYNSEINTKNGNSTGAIISRSFNFKRNYDSLISTPSELPVLDSIKFITAVVALIAHQILYFLRMPVINYLYVDKSTESGAIGYLSHLDVVVDTFFAVSAALHIKGLINNASKGRNILSVLLKRYLRLLGPLALTIYYVAAVAKHTGSGPLWQKYNDDEASVCSKNWVYTLLMLNASVKDSCHLITWYLSCDYQLTVLGALIFYIYSKNKRHGYTAFSIASILAIITPGMMTYWYRLQVIPMLELPDIVNPRLSDATKCHASIFYIRAGPYLVGIAMGFIISMYKPRYYRNFISKKWSIFGGLTSLIVMYHIATLSSFLHSRDYNAIEAGLMVAFNRTFWAFAVCTIIVIFEYGSVPIVVDVMSLQVFAPLSRLSYGLYLVHMVLVQRNLYSTRTPLLFDIFQIVISSAGILLLSVGISLALWFLVEAPFTNLTNHLFNQSKEETTAKRVDAGENGVAQNGNGAYVLDRSHKNKIM